MNRRGRLAAVAVGCAASGLYLGWITRSLEIGPLLDAAARLRPGPLAAFAAAFVLLMIVRAARVALTLSPLRPTSATEVLPSQMAGYLANIALPLQAGELARIALGARHLGLPPGAIASAIAVERTVDLLVALAALAVGLALLPQPSAMVAGVGATMGLLIAVAVVTLAAAMRWPAAVLAAARPVVGWMPPALGRWIGTQVEAGVGALAAMARARLATRYAALCVVQWAAWTACVASTLQAVSLPAGVTALLLAPALATLSLALPAAPGYLGTFQLAYHVALTPLGHGAEPAFVAATLLQLLTIGGALAVALVVRITVRRSRAHRP